VGGGGGGGGWGENSSSLDHTVLADPPLAFRERAQGVDKRARGLSTVGEGLETFTGLYLKGGGDLGSDYIFILGVLGRQWGGGGALKRDSLNGEIEGT